MKNNLQKRIKQATHRYQKQRQQAMDFWYYKPMIILFFTGIIVSLTATIINTMLIVNQITPTSISQPTTLSIILEQTSTIFFVISIMSFTTFNLVQSFFTKKIIALTQWRYRPSKLHASKLTYASKFGLYLIDKKTRTR